MKLEGGGVDSLKVLRKGHSESQYIQDKIQKGPIQLPKKMFSLKGKKKKQTLILLSHKFV